jgi:SHS2 domain-containing protein
MLCRPEEKLPSGRLDSHSHGATGYAGGTRMAATKHMPGWEHFSHGADVGVRGFGGSVEEAFEQAALALTAVVAEVSTIGQSETVEIHCEAPDVELLFVSWLNAVIYEMAVRGMLFSKFHVVVSDGSLTGTLAGEKADPERHDVVVEAKGATVTALKVSRDSNGRWIAQCIVDV